MNLATCFWLKYNDDTKLVTGNVTSTKIYDEAKEKLFPVEILPDKLFFEDSPRYKITSGKLVLRSDTDILKGVSAERKEEIRKQWVKKQISAKYDITEEIQLLNEKDNNASAYQAYLANIQAIKDQSKQLTIMEMV